MTVDYGWLDAELSRTADDYLCPGCGRHLPCRHCPDDDPDMGPDCGA